MNDEIYEEQSSSPDDITNFAEEPNLNTQIEDVKNSDIDDEYAKIKSRKLSRTICLGSIVILIILVGSAMYLLSQDYVLFISDRKKARQSIAKIVQQGEIERQHQKEMSIVLKKSTSSELNYLEKQKKELKSFIVKQEKELQALKQEAEQRKTYLSSTADAKNKTDQLNIELKRLQGLNVQLKTEIEISKSDLSRLSNKKETISTQISDLNSNFKDLKKQRDTLAQEVVARKLYLSESAKAAEAVQENQAHLNKLKQQITVLLNELNDYSNKKLKAIEDTSALWQKLNAVKSELQVVDLTLANRKNDLSTLKNEQNNLNANLMTLQKNKDSLVQQNLQLNSKLAQNQAMLKKLAADAEVAKRNREAITTEINAAKLEYDKVKNQIEQLNIQYKSLTSVIVELNKVKNSLQNKLNKPGK